MNKILNGYKTYLAALAMFLTGLTEIANSFSGEGDFMTGWQTVLAAAALVGIGHKLDKASDK